ncbi:CRISPR-associated helicase/endonuclease Cas3 [Synechococcus sp. WH 8016]|uniref:CRISPR-associated helicase/endonuclease Cas3 n=1 Tax=Synechococcus sp. WH 8016 TaxID=166318 RepID=UPI00022D7D95|nr:CRISPR-associated helicase/endonuclease Cas3 [Synechococcus sp. WH 8016]EHA63801.1 CRISPR-associated HD domain protein [Synechococcus sp. WH 8016]
MTFQTKLIGKLNKDFEYDTVLQHCINAANMAYHRVINLDDRRLNHLANPIGVSTQSCAQLIAIIAGSHDIAKMDIAFQTQRGIYDAYQQINDCHFPSEIVGAVQAFKEQQSGMKLNPLHHGPMAAVILPRLFSEEFGVDQSTAVMMAHCVTAHHGLYPSRERVKNLNDYFSQLEIHEPYREFEAQRLDLLHQLRQEIDPDKTMEIPDAIPVAWSLLVAGLVINADHNASREANFRLINGEQKPAGLSSDEASSVIHRYGIQKPQEIINKTLNGFDIIARPHQEKLEQLGKQDGMTVLKMPTGSGKTIAAFISAIYHVCGFSLLANRRSTANGMFYALLSFLKRNPDATQSIPALAHSDAGCIFESAMESVLADPEAYRDIDCFTDVWKAALALQGESLQDCLSAQYSVATIDQALMSVIADGKFVGRGYWLFSRPIIIDEIHSYDGRMDCILERLLYYCGFFGTPVIALTATISTNKLTKFLEAYAEGQQTKLSSDLELTEHAQAIILSPSGELRQEDLPCDVHDAKQVEVKWFEHGTWFETIKQLAADNDRIAVVCATTTHVRELTSQVRAKLASVGFHVMSYHSRHRPKDRNAKEKTLFEYCGKDPSMQGKIIVIATQVLRESLDVDFDVVVTHVQPAEDLIQIMGRVGRFNRSNKMPTYELYLEEPCITEDDKFSIGQADFVLLPKRIQGFRGVPVLQTYAYLKQDSILLLPQQAQLFVDTAHQMPSNLKDAPVPKGLPVIYHRFWQAFVDKQALVPRAERSQAEEFVIPKLPDPMDTSVPIDGLSGLTRFKEQYISHSPRDINWTIQIFVRPANYKDDFLYKSNFLLYVKNHSVSVSNRPHFWQQAQGSVMKPDHPVLGNVVDMTEGSIKMIGPYEIVYTIDGLGIRYIR